MYRLTVLLLFTLIFVLHSFFLSSFQPLPFLRTISSKLFRARGHCLTLSRHLINNQRVISGEAPRLSASYIFLLKASPKVLCGMLSWNRITIWPKDPKSLINYNLWFYRWRNGDPDLPKIIKMVNDRPGLESRPLYTTVSLACWFSALFF